MPKLSFSSFFLSVHSRVKDPGKRAGSKFRGEGGHFAVGLAGLVVASQS